MVWLFFTYRTSFHDLVWSLDYQIFNLFFVFGRLLVQVIGPALIFMLSAVLWVDPGNLVSQLTILGFERSWFLLKDWIGGLWLLKVDIPVIGPNASSSIIIHVNFPKLFGFLTLPVSFLITATILLHGLQPDIWHAIAVWHAFNLVGLCSLCWYTSGLSCGLKHCLFDTLMLLLQINNSNLLLFSAISVQLDSVVMARIWILDQMALGRWSCVCR